MKPYPWKCPTCRKPALSPTVLPTYTMEMLHDLKKYTVSVQDLPVLQCSECGEIVLDDAADERLSGALRAEIGLLAPDEIRRRREALNLTQKELATQMRLSESTLSRWETGAQIQQRCMDTFLRCFFLIPQVREMLGSPSPTWTVELDERLIGQTVVLEEGAAGQTQF